MVTSHEVLTLETKKTAALLVLVVLVFACGCYMALGNNDDSKDSKSDDNDPSTDDYYPVTFKDVIGNDITLSKKPERVVGMVSALDLLAWVGADYLDLVVGCPQSAGTPSESYPSTNLRDFKSVATLPSSLYSDPEAVIALNPDIVMILVGNDSTIPPAQEFVQKMNSVGIQVFVMCTDSSKYNTIDGFLKANLLPACKIFNEEERGNQIIDQCQKWIDELYDRLDGIKAEDMKYVYVAGAGGRAGNEWLKSTWSTFYPTIYLEDYVYNIVRDMSDINTYELSFEKLYEYEKTTHKIDVIITSSNAYPNLRDMYKEDSSRFTVLSAFQDGEVYGLPRTMARMCDTTLIDVYAIASYLYPELFEGFSIDDFAKEVWSMFFGDSDSAKKLYDAKLQYFQQNLGMTGIFVKIDPENF